MKIARSMLPALAVLLLSSGAQAAKLVDGTDPSTILDVARGFGSAELGTDSSGDPTITGRMEGIKYSVFFYGCDNGKECSELQFTAGWSDADVGMDALNAWNRDNRFGKAYLDNENDPCVELSVNLKFGVSRDNLEDTFDWWKVVMTTFNTEVIQ